MTSHSRAVHPLIRSPSVDHRLRAHGYARRNSESAARTTACPRPKRLPFAHHLFVYSWFFIRGRFSPTDTPAETQNPLRDSRAQPEVDFHLRAIYSFIRGFHSWTVFPLRAHGHARRNSEYAQGQARPVRKTSICAPSIRLFVLNSWTAFPSAHTDTPAEIQNPRRDSRAESEGLP